MAKVDNDIIRVFEGVVKELAMQRDMIIKLNVMTEEEVTNFLNEKGKAYAEHYAPMTEADIMLERIEEILKGMSEGGHK